MDVQAANSATEHNTPTPSKQQKKAAPNSAPPSSCGSTTSTSHGYAQRLKKVRYRGECDLDEITEDMQVVRDKVAEVVKWMRESTHTVVHTGAGISTACGIPDFRGKNGVWTHEHKGLSPPQGTSFEDAIPSFTHMALAALMNNHTTQYVNYIVSQNVDALHLRSGVRRDQLSELHGNVFMEECTDCHTQFLREKEIRSVGRRFTGNFCQMCGGKLRDQCLDWEDALPEYDLTLAERHAKRATLSLCLGTSLRMKPAMDLPVMTARKYGKQECGKVIVCALSDTPLDELADLTIHCPCDTLMRLICEGLGVSVPLFSPAIEANISRVFRCEIPQRIVAKRSSTSSEPVREKESSPKGPTTRKRKRDQSDADQSVKEEQVAVSDSVCTNGNDTATTEQTAQTISATTTPTSRTPTKTATPTKTEPTSPLSPLSSSRRRIAALGKQELCSIRGCEFFGSPDMAGLCSQHWREHVASAIV